MDFGSLFRRKKPKAEPPTAEEPAPEPARAEHSKTGPELELLARVGQPKGPGVDDALAAFRAMRTSPDEARAIDLLLAQGARSPLPEPLAIAVASALVDRDEAERASKTLDHATSSPALLLRADLAAERGDLGTAIALAERVLLRELDHPGARDRHRRWRQATGLATEHKRADASAATVVTQEPDAPFRLLREVARGGAGAVYEAEDRELGRKVALKIYHHPERDRAQLTHEARVAASLAGPNVVRVLDADPEHGWIALEWAALGALRDAIRSKRRELLLPIDGWAVPVAAALAHAHANGWTHLDVKPANVLLRAAGGSRAPMLSDFGIARRRGEPAPPGSFGYISPERLAGRPADPKDDVFGFGRILEDVLDAIADAELSRRYRALAAACTGPEAARPADARILLDRIRIEPS